MANLAEFGASLATTREWIGDLMAILETGNEAQACRALRVTMQELRDHLTIAEVADFSAQLPLLLRGVFYEGWRPTGKPVKRRSKEEFLEKISRHFPEFSEVTEVEETVRDVFEFLSRKVSAGEIRDIVTSLPKDLRDLWPPESANAPRTPAALR